MGLVLSRKQGESIVIDGTIIVTIARIASDKVRLDIVAPSAVPVHRLEIQRVIDARKPKGGGK